MGHILMSFSQIAEFAWQQSHVGGQAAADVPNSDNAVCYKQREEDVKLLLIVDVSVEIPKTWNYVPPAGVDDARAGRNSNVASGPDSADASGFVTFFTRFIGATLS